MDRRNWIKRAVAGIGALLIPATKAKAYTYGGGTITGYTNFVKRPGPNDYYYSWELSFGAEELSHPKTSDPDPRLANGLPYGGRDIHTQTINGKLWMDRVGEEHEGMFPTYVRIGEAGCIRGICYRWEEPSIVMGFAGEVIRTGGWMPIVETYDTHTPGVIPGRLLSEQEVAELFLRERLMDKTQAELDAFHDRYLTQIKTFCVTGNVTYKITDAGYDQLERRLPPIGTPWDRSVEPTVEDILKMKKELEESGAYSKSWPTKLKEVTEQVTIGSFG